MADSRAADVPDSWWVHIHNNRPLEVRALLAQGADPNVRFKNGQPAIMRAVVDAAWDVFDLLAANPRTDLNIENPAGETPLMYLAVAGETERARMLISRGAQVNRLGWTPLHYAASRGRVDTARLLLDQGAMPNAPSPEGRTPLMMAAYSGNPDMVQLLLHKGADPITRDAQGQDAADWAREGKWTALSAELHRVIGIALRQRDALRSNASAAAQTPVQTSVPAQPAAAQAASRETKPDPNSPVVKGVSGVRLGVYD